MFAEATVDARKETNKIQAKKEIMIPVVNFASQLKAGASGPSKVAFTFLQKKGNKTTSSKIEIPGSSNIAIKTHARMVEEVQEKAQMRE